MKIIKKKDLELAELPKMSETVVFVTKNSMTEYELIEIIIEGDEVKSRKVLNRDIPQIIVGKLLQYIRNVKRVSK